MADKTIADYVQIFDLFPGDLLLLQRTGNYASIDPDDFLPTIPVFGEDAQGFSSPAITTVAGATPFVKLNVNTTALSGGNYVLLLSYKWNHDNAGNDSIDNLSFDGSPLGNGAGALTRIEPSDAGGSFSGTGSGQRLPNFSMYFLNGVTPGSKNIQYEFSADSGGSDSSRWDLYVLLFKLSN